MYKIKNPWVLVGGAVVVLGMMLFGILRSKNFNAPKSNSELTQETLAKLVKPSVVRIAQKITGRYSLPDFEIDFNTLTTKIKNIREPEYKQLNEFLTGSGFVVSEDGYIITNAHVVSPETIKATILNQALTEKLEEELKNLSEAEKQNLFKDPEKTEEFANNFLTLLLSQSQFEFKSTLAVLSPTSEKAQIENLFANGFPAKLIDLNENFLFSNKDVALIKIENNNLPTVTLAENFEPNIGSPVFIFGFPASAEFNNQSPVESTLTQGIISALKYSSGKDFKLFQTDAKISQGSSGGPMFNQKGEVVGIITYQSNPVLKALGDNFAFAIPIKLAETLLANNKVALKLNTFKQKTEIAITNFEQRRCQIANQEFKEVLDKANPEFLPAQYFKNYSQSCQEIIASGNSIDSNLANIKENLRHFTTFEWFVIIGRAILTLIVLLILFAIYLKLIKDEKEIKILESEINNIMPGNIPTQNSNVEEHEELHANHRTELGIPHPHLEIYVKEARGVGLTDAQIKNELIKAGWPENEIQNALRTTRQ